MAKRIELRLSRQRKRKLVRKGRKSKDPGFLLRCMIVVAYAEGRGSTTIASELRVAPSTAIRVAHRFAENGEAGLVDRREDNGPKKVCDDLLELLRQLVGSSPSDYGWERTTWSRELLAREIERQTGVSLSRATISRKLRAIGARWGRPKPTVLCPWSPQKRGIHLARIRRLLRNRSEGEVVYFEDEVDIHLNPKIGPDWMLPGTQKRVVTPGQNKKHYLAGALNAHTGEIVWVDGKKKRSALFITLLKRLLGHHPPSTTIHLILDNYIIHSSKQTRMFIEGLDGRVVLHFLPPYSPDQNRIEAEWRVLHQEVTRNHRCKTMEELMENVERYLHRRSACTALKESLEKAA